MKTVKLLFLLIILGLISLLVYQNLDYFMAKHALNLDLKISNWHWTTPELPALAYWGICLGVGLLMTGLKGLITAFSLGREIKNKDSQVEALKNQITDLKTRLDVFIHDPYIKTAQDEDGQKVAATDLENEPPDSQDQSQPETHAKA